MNDAEVSKQVQQMVQFIKQEAEEKANEIAVAAAEEFNIEKLQLVEAEKRKIRQEYERKEKQVEVRKKIEYSTQLNAARLKVLQAQDDIIKAIKENAEKQLGSLSSNKAAYTALLKDLTVQCLLRLKEPAVQLRCRQVDLKDVEGIIPQAIDEYTKKSGLPAPSIALDYEKFLPPPPSSSNPGAPFCSGGIFVATKDGKIVCPNTLDSRLDISFKQNLPEIRKRLFGAPGTGA